jgi:hypothetical protein
LHASNATLPAKINQCVIVSKRIIFRVLRHAVRPLQPVWIKRNSCTYQITSSGAVKNTPRDEAQCGMARCGVRFSTGSTTRRQIQRFRCPSLSTMHYRTMDTHSLGNGRGFDLFPSVSCSVDWQSARKAPVQLILVPAHQ